MRLLNRKESSLLDKLAINEYRIPIEDLISKVAQNLLLEIEKRISIKGKQIHFLGKSFQGFLFLLGPG